MDRDKYKEGKRIYAESQGFQLNPDDKIVDMIVDGLMVNQEKHGAAYCPCRPITGDKEADKKIICPCIYHKDELEKDGKCHCLLFVSKE